MVNPVLSRKNVTIISAITITFLFSVVVGNLFVGTNTAQISAENNPTIDSYPINDLGFTVEPISFNETSNSGRFDTAFYNTVAGSTETFNLSFLDHLTGHSLNDVDFDFIIKKDNQTLFKGSDEYNHGKPLYSNNGNYTLTYSYPTDGNYEFDIPILKVGNDVFNNGNDESVTFNYDVKTQYGFGGTK